MSEETNQVDQEKKPPGSAKRVKEFFAHFPLDLLPLVVLVATVFLVILYANDWKFWDGQRQFETTNDAYVRSDITPLSTKVSGTVSRVLINDFDSVKKGQVLVELRNDDFTARANQAEAVYKQALENINTLKKKIEVQDQRIETARLSTSIGAQEITRSIAGVAGTNAAVLAARSALDEAKAQKAAAQAKLKADEAVSLRAQQERQRQTELFTEKASTQQTVEEVVADSDQKKAVVDADKAEITRLASLIEQRAADITKIKEDLKSSTAQDIQSQDQLKSRDAQLIAEHKENEVLVDELAEAQSAAKAKLAAWQEAKVELDYTKIVAPVDGTLSERRVRAGQQVSAGTQVVTLVSAVPWVIASYRETQMRNIAVGDRAEVSVDALGGTVLKATVQSLSPASEAQFALLPPDNPSGNFTKITQRLPIKLVFDTDQKLVQRLRSGMTVIVKLWPHQ